MGSDRGDGVVLDAVDRAVVAHAVDVPGEDGRDIAALRQQPMHAFPVVAVLRQPAGVVHEDEHVSRVAGLLESLLEPAELLRTHALALGLAEVLLAGVRVALVGVERDEPALLVLQGVPQRAELGFVVLFVFALGPVGAAPVDVVIARDREPRHPQLAHRRFVLLGLGHPLRRLVVAVDQIADREDEVGVEQVGVDDGLFEHADAGDRSAGAVAEHDEAEGVFFLGQLEQLLAGRAVGVDARRLCVEGSRCQQQQRDEAG